MVIMYGKWRPSSLFLFIFKYITLDQIRHTKNQPEDVHVMKYTTGVGNGDWRDVMKASEKKREEKMKQNQTKKYTEGVGGVESKRRC